MDSLGTENNNIQILNAAGGENLLVPGGAWVLRADFVHQGSDLLLVGENGQQVLILNYFNLESPPNIMTDFGAVISAELAPNWPAPSTRAK